MYIKFSVDFVCVISLLCFHNILIIINFNILKYIKKISKILVQCIFNVHNKKNNKKS